MNKQGSKKGYFYFFTFKCSFPVVIELLKKIYEFHLHIFSDYEICCY